jgi:outer membrane protein insertion porin family
VTGRYGCATAVFDIPLLSVTLRDDRGVTGCCAANPGIFGLLRTRRRVNQIQPRTATYLARLVCCICLWSLTPSPAFSQTQPALPTTLSPDLKGRTVEEVRILGNTTVANAIVRNLIRTREGDKFDPATVQEDYQRVFELKKFANVEAKVEPTKSGGVIVVFIVTEQKLLRSIRFHGNKHVDDQTLRNAIDIVEGQAIDNFRIALSKQAIESTYREKNYPFAEVSINDAALTHGDLIFNIVEGPRVRIRNVDFKGVRSFDKDKLKDQIKTASWIFIFRPGRYDPQEVDEDVAALRRFYQNKGFFDVKVGRKLIFSPDQSELEVDFVISEGMRYSVARISFQGNTRLSEATLRDGLKLTSGKPYDSEVLDRDVRKIVRDYSPFGFIYEPQSSDPDYLRVDTKTVYLDQPGKVELVYVVHEGKPFRVGNIFVKGNSKSQQKLVLREFHDFAPGELYNSAEMQDAQDRLKALPYFTDVKMTPIGEDPAVRDLLVEVTENRTASFNIGAGINSNGGVGGNLTYEQRNFDIANVPNDWRDIFSEHAFTGAGQDFRASFEPGTIQTNASLRFSEPWLFDQPYSFSDELYLHDRIREDYDDRRLGDRVSFGKRFNYIWTGSLSLRAEQVKIGRVFDPRYRSFQILEAQGHHPLTSVTLQLRRDTTNPGVLPYKGTVTQASVEGYGLLGGDLNFQKFQASYDAYQSVYEDLIDRRTVLGYHANVGFISGNSVFYERFYGGGIGSLRGFRYRGVSPRDGLGEDPVGGNFSLTGTVELNFPIYGENLRGVLFSDAGDIESGVRLGTIRTSVGAGVRLTLPFLGQVPLAVDFGFPVTKGSQDNTEVVSFSFGLLQ